MAKMTHPDSEFEPFMLPLANGANLSGISFIPPLGPAASSYKPLMVLIHGGRCNAHHFDVDGKHTASLVAKTLSIPVISINRPGYKDTTALGQLQRGTFYHEEIGRWENDYIFPALWRAYGIPNSCSALVAMSHSLGTPGLLVAASLYSQTSEPEYPLAAIILSGWGVWPNKDAIEQRMTWKHDELLEHKDELMLSDPSFNTSEESVRQYLRIQTEMPPPRDAEEFGDGTWDQYWRAYAEKINVPIMYGIGEHDWLWQGTVEQVKGFEACFPSCPRWDGSIVRGAPHAIEWSRCAQGWYARCFGFALEATAWKYILSTKSQ